MIRVFAISRAMSDMARALKQQPKRALAATLLNHPVEDEDFELFALSDLAGVGLPRYLSEGYDVDKSAIRKDHTRLESLDGYVLLLFSRVARQGDITLSPASELTLIGTYTEPKPLHAAAPITTEAAKPYTGSNAPPPPLTRSRVGSAVTGVTVLLGLLILWWILR